MKIPKPAILAAVQVVLALAVFIASLQAAPAPRKPEERQAAPPSIMDKGAAAPEPAGAVIDQVLAAYGGREALAKVGAYRMEGRVTSTRDGREAPLLRIFARPDRLTVVVDYTDAPEKRYLLGTAGWRTGKDRQTRQVDSFLLDSMILQAHRSNLPWLLDEKRDAFRLLPDGGGGKSLTLELVVGEGKQIRVVVDKETHLITRSEAYLKIPMGATHFFTDYSDFRKVDGVLFPCREVNYASGLHTGDTVIEKVTLNPPVTESDFRP